jgi:hypothetical protein
MLSGAGLFALRAGLDGLFYPYPCRRLNDLMPPASISP